MKEFSGMSSPGLKTAVAMRLHDDELAALNAFRRAQQSPPSRTRAAEQIFRRGLSDVVWANDCPDAAR
jgi:hypothetical protein